MKKNSLVSDYILEYLLKKKIKHVFILQGGAIAFMIDAFSRRKDIKYIDVAHEQAAAMMADGYSRVGPNLGVTMSTSGPGATNLITGICCSWFDSVPVLHITGQVNTFEQRGAQLGTKKARQVGFQETNIIDIVSSITKYAVKLNDSKKIKYHFDKAFHISQNDRQGPVLIDIPVNFQNLKISSIKSKIYAENFQNKINLINFNNKINKIIRLITLAKKPIIILGSGVRLSKSVNKFNLLVKILKIPVISTWSGIDSIDSKNKYYFGTLGVYGTKYSNIIVQKSDLILSIGSRLDTRISGGRPDTFAKNAKKIIVDIDKNEISKRRGITPDVSFACDAGFFMEELIKKMKKYKSEKISWNNDCKLIKKNNPIVSSEYYKQKKYVNPYVFFDILSDLTNKKDVLIGDTGAHLTWLMQSFRQKLGQRIFSAFGHSPMGYAFPAAIGASLALNNKRVISINGDGSLQINIQELQTLQTLNIPIKIFVFNNQGYGIIKQFQKQYINSRFEGTIKKDSSPSFERIANAYKIKFFKIDSQKNIKTITNKALKFKGPCLCEVMINPDQQIVPKLKYGDSL
jgi:acetolactate synthase-1/2/3 large subunit